MSNLKKLILTNLMALLFVNILLLIYFNVADYKSKVLYRINFHLDHIDHAYTDLQVHQKIAKSQYPEFDPSKKRYLVYDIINYIYKSGNYEKLKENFNVTKVRKANQVDENKKKEYGFFQVQLILNDDEDYYKWSEQVAISVEEIIQEYNAKLRKSIETSILQFDKKYKENKILVEDIVNKAVVYGIIKDVIAENIKFIIKNLHNGKNSNNNKIENFLKDSIKEYEKDLGYLETKALNKKIKNLFYQDIADEYVLDNTLNNYISKNLRSANLVDVLNNHFIEEYYKHLLSSEFMDLEELTYNNYNIEVLKNFGIKLEKNFKVNATRLTPSKQKLIFSISFLTLGVLNLLYILIFRFRYLF